MNRVLKNNKIWSKHFLNKNLLNVTVGCSVTRLGEISPLWQNFKSLAILWGLTSTWQIFVPIFWATNYDIGQIFFAVNGQIFSN